MPAISDRVYRIQAPYDGNAVHLYLVRGAKLALIDSGAADSPGEAVEPALRELGLGWSDLDFLLNTHGHRDHLGGNSAVKEAAPQVSIGLHPADAHLAGGPEAHMPEPRTLLRLLEHEELIPEQEAVLRRVVGKAAGIERELHDGDAVDLGGDVRLTVVHTPGHTDGSVCFYWEAGGMLFTGDAVQGHGWRAGVTPIYVDTTYATSLDRIEALGASALCMGHTFGSSGVLNDPVRRGAEVQETLDTSRRAAGAIDQAARAALETYGSEASFRELAEAALRQLAFELPVIFDRRTIVPLSATRAIRAHLMANGWRQTDRPA